MRSQRSFLRLFALFQLEHPTVVVGNHTGVVPRPVLQGPGLIKLDIRCAAVVEI
jgi:hypothetical protein